jgi:hypothetical protein
VIITLLVAAIVAGVAVLRGGSLERLSETEFRWPLLVAAGLGLQVGVELWSPGWLNDELGLAVLLASNAFVAAFLFANWKLPGIAIAAVGMTLNVIVIAANGAMPVSQRALERAGWDGSDASATDFDNKHELLDDSTKVPWLADVIPLPYLRTIISLGDVVLVIGIARLVYLRTRPPTVGKHLANPRTS